MTPRTPARASMRVPSIRAACAGILLGSIAALLATDAGAAKAVTCTVSGSGTTMVTTVALPAKSPGRRLTLQVSKPVDPSQGFASQATVTRGRKTVMTMDSALSSAGVFSATVTFGHGFKGIQQFAVTSSDRQTFQASVDGRALLPFVSGADVSSLHFADNGKSPKLKSKGFVARGLEKLKKFPLDSCGAAPGGAAAGGIKPLAFDPLCFIPFGPCEDCDTCFLACNTYNASCRVSAGLAAGTCVAATAGAAAPACVPAWLIAEAGCLKAWWDCGKNCERSIESCGAHLGERCSSSTSCGGDDGCCGGEGNGGDCCQDQDNCCGKKCLENTGNICGDPAKSIVCPFGSGDVCNDAMDLTACCPGSRPACLAFGEPAAPPHGLPSGGLCCQRGQVNVGGCCNPGDVCGETCCPSHVCINGACCAPPNGAVCGGNCCNALTQNCCNGQCCTGTCINNSLCCPKKQACGNVCCAEGTACVNPATGTCQSCLPGTESCEFSPGTPACCPTGTECCNNGQCCAAPNGQCCDFGEGPVCAQTCLR